MGLLAREDGRYRNAPIAQTFLVPGAPESLANWVELMAAFDLPSGDVRDAALNAFMANDVMVLSSGHQSARFRPPLNLSMDEASEGIKRMEKALKESSS